MTDDREQESGLRYVAAYDAAAGYVAGLRDAGMPADPDAAYRDLCAALAPPDPADADDEDALIAAFDRDVATFRGILDAVHDRPARYEIVPEGAA